MKRPSQQGIGLIEVLIAASIIVVGILSLIGSYTIYVQYAFLNSGNVQAAYLLEEGQEVMGLFRDDGWTANIASLSTSTPYYLAFVSSNWVPTTTPQYVDSLFLRQITVSDVQHDSSGFIVASSGTYDPKTKKITVSVQYPQGHATTTRSVDSYLVDFRND